VRSIERTKPQFRAEHERPEHIGSGGADALGAYRKRLNVKIVRAVVLNGDFPGGRREATSKVIFEDVERCRPAAARYNSKAASAYHRSWDEAAVGYSSTGRAGCAWFAPDSEVLTKCSGCAGRALRSLRTRHSTPGTARSRIVVVVVAEPHIGLVSVRVLAEILALVTVAVVLTKCAPGAAPATAGIRGRIGTQ
jgi:hypothetical protein